MRAHALARTLLDRHGVVTRGAVAAEGVEGGFSAVYRILAAFEESGQARRGYVVEGLGAAQFAMEGAVDRLRAVANARERGEGPPARVAVGGPEAPAAPDGFPGAAPAAPSDAPLDDPFSDFPPAATPRPPRPALPAPRTPGTTSSRTRTGWAGHRPGATTSRPATTPNRAPAAPRRRRARRLRRLRGPRGSANGGFGGPRGGTGSGFGGPRGAYDPGFAGHRGRPPAGPPAVVLAAADPANAYGAALPWPEPPAGATHKPGRKAGSLVVLVEGEPALYMERGGKTLLLWPSDPDALPTEDPRLRAAAQALAESALAGSLGTVTVERVNGAAALTSPFGPLLENAGFVATPRGLRIRA